MCAHFASLSKNHFVNRIDDFLARPYISPFFVWKWQPYDEKNYDFKHGDILDSIRFLFVL